MSKEAPSSNYWKRLGNFAIVGGIVMLLCFCIMVISNPSSRNLPTPTTNNQAPATNQGVSVTMTQPIATESVSEETIALITNTLTPIETETPALPTVTNTPDVLSCSIIESVLDNYSEKLTYDQYNLDGGEVDLYIKSLFGKSINFRGAVDDVIGETVFIYDDSCQNRLWLAGIPSNESILLSKGSIISGYGAVGEFAPYQIIHVNVESYQVDK